VSNKKMAITWSRYACVGTGFGWQQQQMDRVAHDHDQNAAVAFRKLCGLGYSRIGLCIPSFYASGRGTRWINGYLACQDKLPVRHRVPVFLASETDRSMTRFRRWLSASRPDAVLSVYGHEEAWLTRLGLKIPRNLGLACLIRNPGTRMAGIDDRYDEVGAATVDVVASKLALNQCGIPPFPRITLIEGRWVSGRGLARKGPEIVLDF
jgi:LacI family transcriptional regulator